MKILSISSAIALLVMSQAAVALPLLSGSIDITGGVNVIDDGVNAIGIEWLDVNNGVAGNQGDIVAASGDFAGLAGTDATMFDFMFDAMPVQPLWFASDGVNFLAFELTSVHVDEDVLGKDLDLSGNGILRVFNGDLELISEDTAAWWDYSSQSGVSFSSNTQTVPEPSIAALIGIGLLGFGFLSRRQKKVS